MNAGDKYFEIAKQLSRIEAKQLDLERQVMALDYMLQGKEADPALRPKPPQDGPITKIFEL